MRLDRRSFLGSLAAGALVPGAAVLASEGSAHAFGFDRPDGSRLPLSEFAGRPVLVVNTATSCGLRNQFGSLEQLWQRYRERGLMLIAVPSNDFGGQEPLDGDAIAEAVRQSHGASYAFVDKVSVRGESAHPFYRWAAAQRPTETPRWNFHKYLVGRDGRLVGGFGSWSSPVGTELVQAIGRELAG